MQVIPSCDATYMYARVILGELALGLGLVLLFVAKLGLRLFFTLLIPDTPLVSEVRQVNDAIVHI